MSGPLTLLKQQLARQARARQLGYEVPVYHGTRTAEDIDRFNLWHSPGNSDFGIHVAARPDSAYGALWKHLSRASNQQKLHKPDLRGRFSDEAKREQELMLRDAAIMPLRLRLGAVTPTVPDLGKWDDPARWLDKAVQHESGRGLSSLWRTPDRSELVPRPARTMAGERVDMPPSLWHDLTDAAYDLNYRSSRHVGTPDYAEEWTRALRDAAQHHGATALRYSNTIEARPRRSLPPWGERNPQLIATPDWSYLVLDPDALRLPWAQYAGSGQGTGQLLRRHGGRV